MKTVNIHEAKTHLSKLLATGEPFVIARAGKPIAKVTAIETQEEKRNSWLGCMEGQYSVPNDFNEMYRDEIIQMFEGE